jgi:hypothetical protein
VWQDQIGPTGVINVGQHMDGPLHATLISQREPGDLVFDRVVLA